MNTILNIVLFKKTIEYIRFINIVGVNGGVPLLRGVVVYVYGWGWVLLLQDKFVLSRNLGYKTRGDRQVAKRSSDPG